MSVTPVDLLGSKYPVCKDSIEKISKKWATRTKNLRTIWPESGTFDVTVCEEMEGLIKNYKPKDKNKKRSEKRKVEQEVLNLFKNEGINFLKNMKIIREMIKKDDEEEKLEKMTQPPPYEPFKSQMIKQMPVVTMSGDVTIEGQVEITPYPEEGNKEPIPLRAGKSRDSNSKAKKKASGCTSNRNDEEQDEDVISPYAEAQEALSELIRGRDEVYRDATEFLRKIQADSARGLEVTSKANSEASEEEEEEEAQSEAGSESSHQARRSPTNRETSSGQTSRNPKEGEYKFVAGKIYLQDSEIEPNQLDQLVWTRKEGGRLRKPVDISTPRKCQKQSDAAGQCPILIKGRQAQYVPWGSQDLDGLVARLPDLHEGAGKWIKMVEDETTGKLLALGDIKALLAKCVGSSKMNELLRAAGLQNAINSPFMDGNPFNGNRARMWQELRNGYPNRIDPRTLKGEHLGEEENPATYVRSQLRKWKEELERDPEEDMVMAALFRNAIVDSMPPVVKARLEDVVGLNSKSHKEFCDHVTHAVEQYRKNEQKLKNQEKELQRKLVQLQLEELARKKKTQAVVKDKDKEEDHAAMMAPVNTPTPMMQQPGTGNTVQPAPGSGLQQPAPIVIYVKPEQQNRFGPRPMQGQGPMQAQQGRQNQGRNPCWGCGQLGHNRRDCPINPWNMDQRQGSRWQAGRQQRGQWQDQRQQGPNWQDQQQQPWQNQQQQGPVNQQQGPINPQQGPVNPWRGPDVGY
ncbi:uncharacterized protein LOC130556800 [Triplophysa rosa]|uniref:uncharacterized protein LOC130556800 n=1 Tax=Triplophysa rosa TaxID=992332 RepID=UPI002545CD4B|nr:uncharacterized protein LOC130556800 [Triplophysa rosa]